MNETAKRTYVFDVVSVLTYHNELFRTWLHLVKDGLVSKNDETTFSEIGSRFVAFISRTKQMPDYRDVVGWIPDIFQRDDEESERKYYKRG